MKTLKLQLILLLICCMASGLFAQADIESKLKKLKTLYDQQLITKTEYDTKRQQILNGFSGGIEEDISYCHFITAGDEEIDFSDTQDDENLVKVGQIIKEILNASGNVALYELRANNSIPNATAVIIKKKRFIQYNPAFIRSASNAGNDWTIYGVFAHELGHHLHFHLDGKNNRHIEELEADEFCGFILNKLGASLEQAQQAVRKLSKGEAASSTHPDRTARLKAVEKGWKKASKQTEGTLSEVDKKFNELVDEAEQAYDKSEFEVAKRRYERALTLKPDDDYVKEQIENIKLKNSDLPKDKETDFTIISELLNQYNQESSKYNPPVKQRGIVTVNYRGDDYGCSLYLKIRIGDREFVPAGNSYSVSDIELGFTDYEISGTINCLLYNYTINPQAASIEVINGAQLYIYWSNPTYGSCTSWLSYY